MTQKTQKILSLQTLRWFAALGVIQYHLWFNYLGVMIKHPGTDFFLVLVAVVAAYSQARYIPSGQWGMYIRNRYIRLYVTYVPVFLITLFAKRDEFSLDWAIRSFFFIPSQDGRLPVVSVTWMLSMFVLFYWVFSLTFLARKEWILVPIFALWSTSVILYSWFGWRPNLPPEWSTLFFQARNLDFIFGYIVGIILRNNLLTTKQGRWIFWAGGAALIAGVVMLNVTTPSDAKSVFVGVSAALVVLGLGALELNHASDLVLRFMTLPVLVWLGATSYVLYLTHNSFLRIWAAVLPVTPALVPIITIGAIIVGALGYRYWEKPVLVRLRQRYGISTTTAANTAAEPHRV